MQKDLGLVTAYGAALEGGYTGTFEDYKTKMLELLDYQIQESYDDTELRELINLKANKTDIPAAYDDTEIRNLISDKANKSDISSAKTSRSGYVGYAEYMENMPPGGYDQNLNLSHSWEELIELGYIKYQDYTTNIAGIFMPYKINITDKLYTRTNYSDPPPYTNNDIHTLVVPAGDTGTLFGNRFPNGMFYGWTKLVRIVFKSGITGIPSKICSGCTSLQEVYIPDTVTSIGDSPFEYCTSLSYVRMPRYLTSIGTMHGLTKANNLQDLRRWWPYNITSIPAYFFSHNTTIPNFYIPNCIQTIGIQAFQQCNNIQTLFIPHGVTYIGRLAFDSCEKLETVYMADTVQTLESQNADEVFSNCPKLTKIYYNGKATGAPWGATNATVVP